jgi:hypothetical protein
MLIMIGGLSGPDDLLDQDSFRTIPNGFSERPRDQVRQTELPGWPRSQIGNKEGMVKVKCTYRWRINNGFL